MNERVRVVSLFSVGLVVAAFSRSRSKEELALGLVSLMLVGVVYFDQTRLSTEGSSAHASSTLPNAPQLPWQTDSPSMPHVAVIYAPTVPETVEVHGGEDAEVHAGEDAEVHAEEDAGEHPSEVLQQRRLVMQDYMMQPSETRKPTAAVLNSYIESLARQHRAENSHDPSLKRSESTRLHTSTRFALDQLFKK